DAAQKEEEQPPEHGRIGENSRNAHQAVDANLDHDPGQDSGNVGGGNRMGAGEPDVKGHYPGLDAEADKNEEKDRHPGAEAHAAGGGCVEVKAAGGSEVEGERGAKEPQSQSRGGEVGQFRLDGVEHSVILHDDSHAVSG